VLINPSGADLESLGDVFAALRVRGPDRAAQPIASIVGAPNRVLGILELQDWNDRAELLLCNEATVLIDVGYIGRR